MRRSNLVSALTDHGMRILSGDKDVLSRRRPYDPARSGESNAAEEEENGMAWSIHFDVEQQQQPVSSLIEGCCGTKETLVRLAMCRPIHYGIIEEEQHPDTVY